MGVSTAVYYFPNWHYEERNRPFHGANWTEWRLMQHATARFPGHDQPKVPLWGYEDESLPGVMDKKCRTAVEYGIEAFVFDWYWYAGAPYLEGALKRGYLGNQNHHGLKFALMWANHDWCNYHPSIKSGNYEVHFPWDTSFKDIGAVWDYIIRNFFAHPDYWRVDGKPYFSIYAVNRFIIQMGGVEKAAQAIALLQEKAQAAGVGEIHVNAIWFDNLEADPHTVCNQHEWHNRIGFSSYTSYNVPMFTMCPREERPFPRLDHREAFDFYLPKATKALNTLPAPYYPVVTMGWDSSPRTIQSDTYENGFYPWLPVMEPTSEIFEGELRDAVALMKNKPQSEQILFVNAWNEWTEGSYLEPDRKNGFGMLEALKRVVK